MKVVQVFTPAESAEDAVMRKIWLRILPFGFLLLLLAQVDKHNISYAALTMREDLNLSATLFGMCISIFYVGYILLEVPSNLVMARVGARTWLARISISIGLVSAATMLAAGFKSLLVIRFLLGMAESGMTPGLLLYFTLWFPLSHRARANSLFLASMPVAGVVASILSGMILELNGTLGLAGWQWLFLLLGIPPLILGGLAFIFLFDRPEKAAFLSAEEKTLLGHMMARDPARPGGVQPVAAGWKAALLRGDVLFLAGANLGLFITLSILTTWTPQIVRSLASGDRFALFGWIAAAPPFAAAISMPLWSRRSDLHNERRWHVATPMLLATTGLLFTSSVESPWLKLAGLVCVAIGAYGGYGVFWSLVAQVIPGPYRPAGIAMIHAFGSAGAIISPIAIGYLQDLTHNFAAGLLFGAVLLTVSVVLVLAVKHRSRPAAALDTMGPPGIDAP